MKSLFKIMVVCLSLLMAVSFAYAGNGKGKCFGKGVRDGSGLINTTGVTRPNYVDKNGDGICDNSGAKTAGAGCGRSLGYGRGCSYSTLTHLYHFTNIRHYHPTLVHPSASFLDAGLKR